MRLRDKVAAGLVRVDDNQAESQVDGQQTVVGAPLCLEPGRGDQRVAERLPEVELRGEVFVIGLSDDSKVPAQSLRARLADMKCSTDGA
jgi:hypothetical protein